jgi:hypothetical protein
MMKILEQLGVYGWPLISENILLASLLTGDPLLMVGSHGTAKTHIGYSIAKAVDKKFLAYDASKALFEDVLGFPNITALKAGRMAYVPSAVTIWDKEFILIDEINRALPELQAKWLEIIRSRKIMGFPTSVKWVWAAMNPSTDAKYSGTQALDAALLGRFAMFIYPPDVLDMIETDRIRVVSHINGDDAPSLSVWLKDADVKTVCQLDVEAVKSEMSDIFETAAANFILLKKDFTTLGEFLSRMSVLIMKETDNKVRLDGRRLGFIYRNILAVRAIEMARQTVTGDELPKFSTTAEAVLRASIPIGLGADGIDREATLHQVILCFNLLSEYFKENSELAKVETIYKLFTCQNVLETLKILIKEDLSDLAKTKAWGDISKMHDGGIVALASLEVEAKRPGTIPAELIAALANNVTNELFTADQMKNFELQGMNWGPDVVNLISKESGINRCIAISVIRAAMAQVSGELSQQAVDQIRLDIDKHKKTVKELLEV